MKGDDRLPIQKFRGIIGGLHGVAHVPADHDPFAVNGDEPLVIIGVRYGIAWLHRSSVLCM
jgi:hypothetical protein